MIDLKREIERELSLIDPPDLWDRIQAEASDSGDAAVGDLTTARHRRRPSLWLAVAAVTVLLALIGALALLEDHQTVDTTPATELPVVPEPRNNDGPTTLAKGDDVKIVDGCTGNYVVTDDNEIVDDCQTVRMTLSIDAEEEDGEVTGELRVDNVVVTLHCAGTRGSPRRDLILAGEVTSNPGGLATLDEVNVAVGDLVALIIREDDPDLGQRVTLYQPSLWYGEQATAGSCSELVESVPLNLDGGFFKYVVGGIETG